MHFSLHFSGIQAMKITAGVAVLYISTRYLRRTYLNYQDRQRLDKLRQKRKREREEQISKLKETINPDEKTIEEYTKICKLTVLELKEKLFKRELFAEDVLKACIYASLNVQDEFNCITEFIPSALEKAKHLDKMHMVKGPLHGLPFCVKDDTTMKGYDSTIGCSRRLYKPKTETAIIVQCLEQLGAIPFCRTNIPQTCISFGSSNPIYGKTLNPLNKKLGPGGSSSGTGCLVGSGGCPFGLGSDTGGSLRAPAHFCGVSTLKSTSSRLSRRGCTKCVDLLPAIPGVIAKNAADVACLFQAITEYNLQNKLDGTTVPISWNSQMFESKQKHRIGYINSFSQFPPIGDSGVVIERAKTFLESTGNILVPFELPFDASVFLHLQFDADLKRRFQTMLKNDEIADSIEGLYSATCQPSYVHKLKDIMAKLYGLFVKDTHTPEKIPNREELIHKFLDKMNAENIDAIICPVLPFPAISIEDVPLTDGILIYTMMFNWLDLPAGVVKFWNESGIHWTSSVNALDKGTIWKKVLLKNAADCVGMPIGVQVVGRPYQEEMVLNVMLELDDINK